MKTITITVPTGEIGCYSGPYSIVNERVTYRMSFKQVEALKFLIGISRVGGSEMPWHERDRIETKIKEAEETLGIKIC